jgi:hypothetical protein
MIDLPRRTPEALLIGMLGFKGYADYPEEAKRGRRLTGVLRRDLRRLCTEPLYARSLRERGIVSPRPSLWSTPAALSEQRRGLPIRQEGVAFVEFIGENDRITN